MSPLILVMIGGAIGSALRYLTGLVALRQLGPGFPYGTLAVNLIGGLLMGVLAGVLARAPVEGEPLRLLIGVGVLGGFTTFSAFSLESFNMLSRGDYAMAGGYVALSVAGSLLALFCGVGLTRIAA